VASTFLQVTRVQALVSQWGAANARYVEPAGQVQKTLQSFQKATAAGDRVSTNVISHTCSELMAWELLLPKGACKLLRDQLWFHLEAAYNTIESKAPSDPESVGAEVPSPDHFKEVSELKDCIVVAKEIFPDKEDLHKMLDGIDGRLKNFDKEHRDNAINAACTKYMDTSDFREVLRLETILN